MLAAAVIDFLFGLMVGMWFAQTSVGKGIIAQVQESIKKKTEGDG